MRHIPASQTPWQHKPGYSKRIYATPEDLQQPGLLVQELRIAPGQVAENHYHKQQTEIFYFLNTAGEFSVNGKVIPLQVGDVLIVEPNDVHEVRNLSKEDFCYVAFKFNFVENDYFENEKTAT
ncbi:MAG: cupin domain-containing protein [Patescibacteria group bacterium]|jgi:quercetin dioxygenase-like cupin family protein